jgi:cysteine desulfurase
MLYFDANATTPLHPEAREAWLRTTEMLWQNPGAPTAPGARAHAFLEQCRKSLLEKIAATGLTKVVFTSGATEANNAVIASEAQRSPHLAIVSAVEHASVLEPARQCFGARLRLLPVDGSGVVCLDTLKTLLAPGDVALVCVMAVNNETGVIQPMAQVRELTMRHGARLLCDATQWFGKMPVSALSPCDFLVGSAHKFGGTKGVGFLALDSPNFSAQRGGRQEDGIRAGTENLPGIAAMLAALDVAENFATAHTEAAKGRELFEAKILHHLPGTRIHGQNASRVWNTALVSMPAHGNLRWLKRLERHGFTVSTGSACSAASGKLSHVLAAMGCDDTMARRALRISALPNTPPETWLALAQALEKVSRELGHGGTGDFTHAIQEP